MREHLTSALLLLLPLAFLAPVPAHAAFLGEDRIEVVGLSVDVDGRPDLPGVQAGLTAVENVPTSALAVLGRGEGGLPPLPDGVRVKAEIEGPSFPDGPVTLEAAPGALLSFPTLGVGGTHYLTDIRLEDAGGSVLLERDPRRPAFVIDVIEELLVTRVVSRPLSLEEIEARGIVIDEDNFTALNFSVGLTVGSDQVEVDVPIVIPTTPQAQRMPLPQLGSGGLRSTLRQFETPRIPNLSLSGFTLQLPPEVVGSVPLELPPIQGVMIIPGNVAFLNQFFSVILQATNATPEGSGLLLRNARARIVLPAGGDEIPSTGDDPLGLAEIMGETPSEEQALEALDGSDTIAPSLTSSSEFLVEGLREGTHRVRFEIEGDLFVPSLGETFPVSGEAVGVVQVANPTFDVVLAHPDVVRDGEPYSIFVTVTNTSSSPANLFQLALATRSLSGAVLRDGESPSRSIETLPPGGSAGFAFDFVAATTGEVRSTVALTDPGVNGSFVLTTGVGDTGIPLSPDTLVLPSTVDFLPEEPDLVGAAQRLLGLAYSAATAPSGRLPPDVARVPRATVFERAATLARNGLYVRFGESVRDATLDVLFDYLGRPVASHALRWADPDAPDGLDPEAEDLEALRSGLAAFDAIRRTTDAGAGFSRVVSTILRGPEEHDSGELLERIADRLVSTGPLLGLAVEARGAAPLIRLRDAEGAAIGRLEAGSPEAASLPFAIRLPLVEEANESDTLLLVGVVGSERYVFDIAANEATEADLSLVLPADPMAAAGLRRATWTGLALEAGGRARLRYGAETPSPQLELDADGDGAFESSLAPDAIGPVVDSPPTLVGVEQWAKGGAAVVRPTLEEGDPIGRLVGVLFSEPIRAATGDDATRYAVPGIGVARAATSPGDRLVFVSLDRPVGPFVERSLEVQDIEDLGGQATSGDSMAIRADPARGVGGRFAGQVVEADGRPVPFASVLYIQPLSQRHAIGCGIEDRVVARFEADVEGRFEIDFVLQSDYDSRDVCSADVWLRDDPPTPTTNHFKLEAIDGATGRVARASSRIQTDGQRQSFRLVLRGEGSARGRLVDGTGTPVSGIDPVTGDALRVSARHLETGRIVLARVEPDGRFGFPSVAALQDGSVEPATGLRVGNVALRVVRPSDGLSGITTIRIPESGAIVEQDIVMQPAARFGSLRGRIVEVDGVTPAANVPVEISGEVLTGIGLYSRTTTYGGIAALVTDADGAFALEDVPAGRVGVRVVRRETLEVAEVETIVREAEQATTLLVLPGGGGLVRGILRDALGNPVAGATVVAGPMAVTTDADGRFEIAGLPLGRVRLFAQGSDSPSLAELSFESTGPEDVQEVALSLPPTGSIVGTVVAADGETPVDGVTVQLWADADVVSQSAGLIAERIADASGRFRFDGFPVGGYSVRSLDRNTLDGGEARTTIRFAGDVRDADVVFRGIGTVTGRVVQSSGTPVLADVIVSGKSWQILRTERTISQQLLFDSLQAFGEIEELSETVQAEIERNGLDGPVQEFYVLGDFADVIQSDERGPGGELTGRFTSAVLAGPFQVSALGPFLRPAQVSGAIPRTPVEAERAVDVGDIVLGSSTASVEGTVFLPDGTTPVGAGVVVGLRSLDSSGSVQIPGFDPVSEPALPEIDVVTDADGRFAFPLVLAGRVVLIADTGEPPAGTRATGPEDLETEHFEDASGARRLNVRLRGRSSGSAPAGRTLTLDVRLRDVAGARVRVVEDDGVTPVGGARVAIDVASTLDDALPFAVTDAQGEIDFFPIGEGGFTAIATLPGDPRRGSASAVVPRNPPNGLELPLTVTLGAATSDAGEIVPTSGFATLFGPVLDAQGARLVNPTEIAITAGGVSIRTSSDETGYYVARDVPLGPFRIEAFEPFTGRRGVATGTTSVANAAVERSVRLVGLGNVIGQVRSSDGTPLAGEIDVFLMPEGDFTERLVTRTNLDGRYDLPGVPVGAYTVLATDPATGLAGRARDVLERDGGLRSTDVRLQGAGRITGIVYGPGVRIAPSGDPLDATGAPFPGAPRAAGASVEIRAPGFVQTLQADEDGRFETASNVPIGAYSIVVRSLVGLDGTHARAVVAFDGEQAFVAAALDGRGIVSGIVLDSLGVAPAVGAAVTLSSASPFLSTPISRITNAQGRFEFTGVPVGGFGLSVEADAFTPPLGAAANGVLESHASVVRFVDADADPEHEALRLQPSGAVLGVALLGDGVTRAEGAVATLDGEGHHVSRLADVDGAFSFRGVPLGDYRLSILEPTTDSIASRALSLSVNGEAIDLGDVLLDGETPRIVATTPAPLSGGVDPLAAISVVFSEPIDADTVDASSFVVTVDGQPRPGTRLTEDATIRFVPDAPLPDLKRVQVELRGDRVDFDGTIEAVGLRDRAGQSLFPDFRFSFLTTDTTPPDVVRLGPPAGAIEVAPHTVLRIEFDEPIDPASVGGFLLETDGSPIAGTLGEPTLGGRVLVFVPDAPLPTDRRYDATLFGPLTDLLGNPRVPTDLGWSFTTIDTAPPSVDALTILPGPPLLEGHSLRVAATATDPTSELDRVEFFVDGSLFASRAAGEAFEAALPLTAARTGAIQLSAVAVDRAGNRSAPRVIGAEVAPNGPPSVAILAPAPILVSQGDVLTIEIGASDDLGLASLAYVVDGGERGGSAIALANETSVQRAFSFTVPADAPIDGELLIEASATDRLGRNAVAAPVRLTVEDRLPPFVEIGRPSADTILEPGTTLPIFVRADDASGIERLEVELSGALTGAGVETASPARSPLALGFDQTIPAGAASGEPVILTATAVDGQGLSRQTQIQLRLRDAVPPTVSASIVGGPAVEAGTEVSARILASDNVAVAAADLTVPGVAAHRRTFSPSPEVDTEIAFAIPAERSVGDALVVQVTAEDEDGNTTEASPIPLTIVDRTPPEVRIATPMAGFEALPGAALDVRVDAADLQGVSEIECRASGAVTGSDGASRTPVPGAVQQTCSFLVPADAPPGAAIDLVAEARDEAGNAALSAAVPIAVADVVAPILVSIDPADGATGVAESASVTIVFDEAMDASSVEGGLSLRGVEGEVPGGFASSGDRLRFVFTPDAGFAFDGVYTVEVAATARDVSGNPLAAPFVSTFSVQSDFAGPCLVDVFPRRGAVVSTTPLLRARFDEPLDPTSVTEAAVRLGDPSPVGIDLVLAQDDTTLLLIPRAPLALDRTYALEIDRSLTDRVGNPARSAAACAGGEDDGSPLVGPPRVFTTGGIALVEPEAGTARIESEPLAVAVDVAEALDVTRLELEANGLELASLEDVPFATILPTPTRQALGEDVLRLGGRALLGRAGNVAGTGFASASGVDPSLPGPPGLAIDGNADGDAAAGSVTSVVGEPFAWWQVDFGSPKRLESIELSLRSDCCEENNRLLVLAALEPFDDAEFREDELPARYANGALELHRTPAAFDQGVVTLSGPEYARYLRVVSLVPGQALALAEVEARVAPLPLPERLVDVLAAGDDLDGDGLSNGDELTIGSDPRDPDSDDDGLLDGVDPLPLAPSPAVLSVSPADRSVDIDPATSIALSFSRALDAATLDSSSVFLRESTSGLPVASRLELSPDARSVTLVPDAPLALATTFEVVATPSVAAPDGAALAEPFVSSFETTAFALIRPVDGDPVVENRALALEAAAGAGLPIERVEFYAEGVLLGARDRIGEQPYRLEVLTPRAADRPSWTIEARAIGLGEIVLASDFATVEIVVDVDLRPRLLGIGVGESRSVEIRLSGPFSQDVSVDLSLVDPSIAALSAATVVIPAGETSASVDVSGLVAGATSLVARTPIGDSGAVLSVSPLPSGASRRTDAPPVGLRIRAAGDLGRLYLPVGGSRTLLLPLVGAPVDVDTDVDIRSDAIAIADATTSLSILPAGERTAEVTLVGIAPGRATLFFEIDGVVRDLAVIVGPPVGESGRIIQAPRISLEVTP